MLRVGSLGWWGFREVIWFLWEVGKGVLKEGMFSWVLGSSGS